MNVGVVGLGKVGIVLSLALVEAGHRVSAVDVSRKRVEEVLSKSVVTDEQGVVDGLKSVNLDSYGVSTDFGSLKTCEVVFIIVPTPSEGLGGFSLDYVLDAVESVGKTLKKVDHFPTVSLVSTVMPGASTKAIIPALESSAGRVVGESIGYCYNPTFIALGDVRRGFTEPEMVLIGSEDAMSGDVVGRVHSSLVPSLTPIVRMTTNEAEITKLASNSHETMRVAFVNMLLAACEQTPGTDVDRITHALTHRHGQRLFRGATPYGGPCWPRDNHAMAAYLQEVGAPSSLPRTIHESNEEHSGFLISKIRDLIYPDDRPVVIAGVAYKTGTGVTDESFGVRAISQLAESLTNRIVGWDPLVSPPQLASVEITNDLYSILPSAGTLVITQPHQELRYLDWSKAPEDITVIDCWRLLSSRPTNFLGRYVPLGRNTFAD